MSWVYSVYVSKVTRRFSQTVILPLLLTATLLFGPVSAVDETSHRSVDTKTVLPFSLNRHDSFCSSFHNIPQLYILYIPQCLLHFSILIATVLLTLYTVLHIIVTSILFVKVKVIWSSHWCTSDTGHKSVLRK